MTPESPSSYQSLEFLYPSDSLERARELVSRLGRVIGHDMVDAFFALIGADDLEASLPDKFFVSIDPESHNPNKKSFDLRVEGTGGNLSLKVKEEYDQIKRRHLMLNVSFVSSPPYKGKDF